MFPNHNYTKKQKPPATIILCEFEEYLKPKKKQKLLFERKIHPAVRSKKTDLNLKLLQHPVLGQDRPKASTKYENFKEKCKKFITTKRPTNCDGAISKFAKKWHNKTFGKPSRFSIGSIKLPKFLSFLRARNDDGLCKRKSGFEIYCEMASIHGFINFVGSSTWQRAFWFFVIVVAVAITGFILILSHLMTTSTPTILYIESAQYPSWKIPFPAVTICNVNRISKSRAEELAQRFSRTTQQPAREIAKLFNLALFNTENLDTNLKEIEALNSMLSANNFTLKRLLNEITPNCASQLLKCKWKGRIEKCDSLFQKINTTTNGQCCTFNSFVTMTENSMARTVLTPKNELQHITSCGYKTGLTVLLQPNLKDYQASIYKTPGFQIIIHDAVSYPDEMTKKLLVTTNTQNKLSIKPEQTYASSYMSSEALRIRKCYMPQEKPLFYFQTYSQTNCLTECRSLRLYQRCYCVLPFWPRKEHWRICDLQDIECVYKNIETNLLTLKSPKPDYRTNHYAEQFVCDCFPACDFNMYNLNMDTGDFNRRFAKTDNRFFKNVNITEHILLHIFYDELTAVRLRLDVYENWLSFIGTFGGITGLNMGYSFVSGFEMIFFVFVRPACNWMTKKQIRYRIKRRRAKAAKEEENKRQLKEQKEKEERIEAYLKMRPYCPGY